MSEILLDYPHEAQQKILKSKGRFNHIRCGRRFGKTHLIELLVTPAIDDEYNAFVGIWFPTYKDLSEVWRHIKVTFYDAIQGKDEQLKQIRFKGGGLIDFWSMDDPDSGRGRKYHRAIIDEAAKAKKFKQAWNDTIRPTLTDFKGDAWIFSTPKGKANYFYQLEKDMKGQKDWVFQHYTTYDNPYIDPKEVDEAKMQLDSQTFDQEYRALYVDLNDKPFLYTFNEKQHVKKGELMPARRTWISHDFNVGNMTAGIAQEIDYKTFHILREIDLKDSDTYEVANHIKAMYPDLYPHAFFTGDATGSNRNQGARGALSNWKILKTLLRISDGRLKVTKTNLNIEKSYQLVNSVMQRLNIYIDPSCEKLLEDCREGRIEMKLMQDGSYKMILIKDESTSGMHHLDWFRYVIHARYYDFLQKFAKYK